jgi:hypothetical protein
MNPHLQPEDIVAYLRLQLLCHKGLMPSLTSLRPTSSTNILLRHLGKDRSQTCTATQTLPLLTLH